jgi:hypothetical protein
LVIDESFIGILKNGCGIIPLLIIKHQKKNHVASLGKAFGLTGGVIASDSSLSSKLQKTRFCVERRNESFCPNNTDAIHIYCNIKTKDNLEYI